MGGGAGPHHKLQYIEALSFCCNCMVKKKKRYKYR